MRADYERPQLITSVLGAVVRRDGDQTLLMALQRRGAGKRLAAGESDFLEALIPHIDRAFQIRQQLLSIDTARQAAHNAFDRLAMGIALLADDGSLVFLNHRGEELLASGAALTARSGKLRATADRENAALQDAVKACTRTSHGGGLCAGEFLELRAGTAHAMRLMITPLGSGCGAQHCGTPSAAVAIFFSPASHRSEIPGALLMRFYGFTKAEARLASRLMKGESLETAAREFDISIHTARSQIKSIFQKSGTSRQSELISNLLAGPLGAVAHEQTAAFPRNGQPAAIGLL